MLVVEAAGEGLSLPRKDFSSSRLVAGEDGVSVSRAELEEECFASEAPEVVHGAQVQLGFRYVEGSRNELFPQRVELLLQSGVQHSSGFANQFGWEAEIAGRHRDHYAFMESKSVEPETERDVIVARRLRPVVP